MRRTRFVTLLIVALLTVSFAGTAALAAPPDHAGRPIVGDAIYADGRLFGTILLGDLPFNDNPQSFDTLYMIPDQPAVAEAAPGAGYNGGRWIPVAVTWNVAPYLLTSSAAVLAAEQAGHVTLGPPQYDATFFCPLIPQL